MIELITSIADVPPSGRPTDDISSEPILEILYGEAWIVTGADIFDSWTGLRRKNGSEFHGSVVPLGTTTIHTGARVCGCSVCQEHVEAKFKKN